MPPAITFTDLGIQHDRRVLVIRRGAVTLRAGGMPADATPDRLQGYAEDFFALYDAGAESANQEPPGPDGGRIEIAAHGTRRFSYDPRYLWFHVSSNGNLPFHDTRDGT